jgi:hypothetical protein
MYIDPILETYELFARRKKFREQKGKDKRIINPIFAIQGAPGTGICEKSQRTMILTHNRKDFLFEFLVE